MFNAVINESIEFKQQQQLRQRKHHLKIKFNANMHILRLFLTSHKWTRYNAVKVNIENERFTVAWFTLLLKP